MQSPKGDWADCDTTQLSWSPARWDSLTLQSPKGDWADCDELDSWLLQIAGEAALQSPEGDWADCDSSVCGNATRMRMSSCNPLKGIGPIATIQPQARDQAQDQDRCNPLKGIGLIATP